MQRHRIQSTKLDIYLFKYLPLSDVLIPFDTHTQTFAAAAAVISSRRLERKFEQLEFWVLLRVCGACVWSAYARLAIVWTPPSTTTAAAGVRVSVL